MKNVHQCWIKGGKRKYSGYKIQTKKNVNNLKRVRREASRHFRNKKKEYLETKIDELETNRKIENISDFKNG